MAGSTRATKTKMVGGRVVSAKSKTGDPACSSAMSQWVATRKSGTTPASVFAMLGQCRAKARALKQGESQRAAGNEAKAQRLEAIARGEKGPITAKDRLARAREIRANLNKARESGYRDTNAIKAVVDNKRNYDGESVYWSRRFESAQADTAKARQVSENRKAGAAKAAETRKKNAEARKTPVLASDPKPSVRAEGRNTTDRLAQAKRLRDQRLAISGHQSAIAHHQGMLSGRDGQNARKAAEHKSEVGFHQSRIQDYKAGSQVIRGKASPLLAARAESKAGQAAKATGQAEDAARKARIDQASQDSFRAMVKAARMANAKRTVGTWPSIDHSLISPSGRMSNRARKAAEKRENAKLFAGVVAVQPQQPAKIERADRIKAEAEKRKAFQIVERARNKRYERLGAEHLGQRARLSIQRAEKAKQLRTDPAARLAKAAELRAQRAAKVASNPAPVASGPSLMEQAAAKRASKGDRLSRLEAVKTRLENRIKPAYEAIATAKERMKAIEKKQSNKRNKELIRNIQTNGKSPISPETTSKAYEGWKKEIATQERKVTFGYQRLHSVEKAITKAANRATPEAMQRAIARVQAKRAYNFESRRRDTKYHDKGSEWNTPARRADIARTLKAQRAKKLATPEAQSRIAEQSALAESRQRAKFSLFGGKLPEETYSQPVKPSLREQADAARASKGTMAERKSALANRWMSHAVPTNRTGKPDYVGHMAAHKKLTSLLKETRAAIPKATPKPKTPPAPAVAAPKPSRDSRNRSTPQSQLSREQVKAGKQAMWHHSSGKAIPVTMTGHTGVDPYGGGLLVEVKTPFKTIPVRKVSIKWLGNS